ncbi:MAG: alpha-glucuronidase [Tannerellaceae bacterium]|jgi:alpha-glucuronidase|nr:alpha-glucuronidase [Tannerellaceae bacterium]
MKINAIIIFTLLLSVIHAGADNGSKLWLRNAGGGSATVNFGGKMSPTISIVVDELRTQWKGGPIGLDLSTKKEIKALGADGFRISGGPEAITIASSSDKGLLYGAFHLLRLQACGAAGSTMDISESPAYQLRILNHWDNLNRSVERGYAGLSLWEWEKLPAELSPRYREYARANASIGINGSVLNNVNASPTILTKEYLPKVKAIADVFRPWGIKVYLSANFSSPKVVGGLDTSDPLDKNVRKWWKDKAAEIYALIPDFGGFLVKANSEGQPGPHDFGRTHADGANMLADALAPHGGIVMWRAFVYNPSSEDRARQACEEFMPLDGKFRPNVIIQVKNGPVDFQPREPFTPLFGGMQQTAVMPELQITQEYLGFSNHLVFLAPLFEEFLKTDTYARGPGSTVAATTDGSLFGQKISAIAGVANTGSDANWCGHHFAQSNWYAFGRLAWNHRLTSDRIADEWIRQTFGSDELLLKNMSDLMMRSREAAVDYMMPLCLHHIFSTNHHYGPEPWFSNPNMRRDWQPPYYHKADSGGVGFDRTASGSNAVAQYFSPLRETYANPATCPENLLLWFHHLPWDYKMKSGRTLWDELCYRYAHGVEETREFQKIWDRLEHRVDAERFAHVSGKLRIQARDAIWWRDACLLYFQTLSGMPIPLELERPLYDLPRLMKQPRTSEAYILEGNYYIK